MREFGQIRLGFWSSPDTVGLGDQEKLLAIYLIAGPHTTALGCFRCPAGYIASDLGWPPATVSKRLGKLFDNGFATVGKGDFVFIKNFLRHNPPQNPNVWRHILKLFDGLPTGLVDIKTEIINKLEVLYRSAKKDSKGWEDVTVEFATVSERFRNGLETVPERFRNNETETETETILDLEGDLERDGAPPNPPRGELVVDSPSQKSDDVGQVVEHYRSYHSRARPGTKEKKKIRERIKEGYGVAELCLAIDGMHKTPHNIGENDANQEYLALELCMRNSGQIDRFCENADKSATGKMRYSKKTMANLNAAQSWLERENAGM